MRLPPRSPNLKAQAEGFVCSIKECCLARAASPFVRHGDAERNDQGLQYKIIRPEFPVLPDEGEVVSRRRLGGLLRYYYAEAA